MTTIDLNRLRRYHTDASAAHGALMGVWERLRSARADVGRAKNQLHAAQHNIRGVRTYNEKAEAPFVAAVKVAEDRLAHINLEQARAERAWTHAAAIKELVRAHALNRGVLPTDLMEN